MDVADLASQSVTTPEKLAVDDDTAANPGFQHQKQGYTRLALQVAIAFPKGKRVCVVFDHDWQVGRHRLADQMLQVL